MFDTAGQKEIVHQEVPIQPTQLQLRSEQNRRPSVHYGIDEYLYKANEIQTKEIDEPMTTDEAMKGNYETEWKKATNSEYSALMENNTWELVELPKGRKAIGCKWVFHVKYDGNGEVERFKGKLVAQGFSQNCGTDYEETSSPVARFSLICTILAYAAQRCMLVHQIFKGDLKEDIYMQQPTGYIQPG